MMGTGALVCYNMDGNEAWRKDLQTDYGKFDIQFGMASTPVLDKDRLYLQLIHSGGAKVIATRQIQRQRNLASQANHRCPR